jgi:hypothetical protein
MNTAAAVASPQPPRSPEVSGVAICTVALHVNLIFGEFCGIIQPAGKLKNIPNHVSSL